MPDEPDELDAPVATSEQTRSEPPNTLALLAVVGGVMVGAIVVVLVLGLAVFGWFGDSSSTTATSTSYAPPSLWRTSAAAPPPQAAAAPLPSFVAPATGVNCTYTPTQGQPAGSATAPSGGKVPTQPAVVNAGMVTNYGTIGLRLDNEKAPCTVHSFVSLAEQGYFDDTTCHRLTTSTAFAVLQCGDPTASSSGGPGYEFANEYPTDQYIAGDPALQAATVYPRGTVAMANGGEDTNGSQFFLVYQDTELPPVYTIFGTIDKAGLAALDKIGAAGTADGSEDGAPKTPVTVESIAAG